MIIKKIIATIIAIPISLYSLQLPRYNSSFVAFKTIATNSFNKIEEDGLVYKKYDDHIELVGHNNDVNENVIIPDKINNLPVTKIYDDSFYELNDIKSIYIPESINEIGDFAFTRCSNLESITGMNGVKKIGNCAFLDCENIISITLTNALKETGYCVFGDCKGLESLALPDSLVDLGAGAFWGCEKLESIRLSRNIKELKSMYDDYDVNDYIGTFDGCTNLKEIELPEDIAIIGERTFYGCTNLKEIVLPESIEKIGEKAFYECCKLESIAIPKNVKEIGDAAFCTTKIQYGLQLGGADCGSLLQEITVDKRNNYYCSIDGVLYNKQCNKIIQYPLGREEDELIIPQNVTVIGHSAFCYLPIRRISFLGEIEEIGDDAFWCCTNLMDINLPESLVRIGRGAFGNTDLDTIVIPKSVSEIGFSAFFATHLDDITILNSDCKIGDDSSYNYQTIDSGLGYFTGIIYGYYNSTAQEYAHNYYAKFISIDDKPELIIDNGLKYYVYSDHSEVIGVEKITQSITVPPEVNGVPVTEIGKKAFDNTYLSSVILPDTITRIDDKAFSNTRIEKISIPSNVCVIGSNAFYNCNNLCEVSLPNSVLFIAPFAFGRCKSLMEITIPKDVREIGKYAFDSESGLKINGYIDSQAEEYAQNNDLTFVALSDENDVVTTTTTTTTKIPKTTTPEARDNYCNNQDNEEAEYDGSYWVQPSAWGSTKIEPNVYNGNGTEIKISKITVIDSNAPGSVQTVNISYNGPDEVVSSIAFHILWDTRMEIQECRGNVVQDANDALNGFATLATEIKPGIVAVVSSAGGDNLYAGDMYTMTFKLPTNAKAGDLYPIGIVYKYDEKFGDLFYNADQNNAGKLHMAYVFTQGIENGYIKVVADNTTSTTTTTTSTTTTTITTTQPQIEDYDLGDVNNDGMVDGSDATWVLREFGNVLAGKGESFAPEQFKAGDVDLNGVIDGSDATLILKFFGEAGKDISISYGGMKLWMDNKFWNKK